MHGDAFRTVSFLTFALSQAKRVLGCGRACFHAVAPSITETLVACIENLCLSPHGVSSIERSARLHDMLEAQRTRQMVAALKGNHRGLGLLYGSIANAKPMRCALYTHLAAFFNRSGVRTV